MPLETDTVLEEDTPVHSHLDDFFEGILKKFENMSFNQEKSSFIIQNISIALSIKALEIQKNFFKDLLPNQLHSSPDSNQIGFFPNFYMQLKNFVRQYIDPFYESNDISYYIASNEDNFSILTSIFVKIIADFPKEYLNSSESIIDSFIDYYLIYTKPKKDFSTLSISKNSFEFLLMQSLQKDLAIFLADLSILANGNSAESFDDILDKILNYHILDPITFNGFLLSRAFTYLVTFYDEIIRLSKNSSNELFRNVLEKLFGHNGVELEFDKVSRIIVLRHLFGIIPDKDSLLVTKLNIYMAMNTSSLIQNPVKTNLHFNFIKGNILLGFKDYSGNGNLSIFLQDDVNQNLAKDIASYSNKFSNFIISLESADGLKSLQDTLSNIIRNAYLKELVDLKIKSDLQERLAIVNPYVDFLFLKNSQDELFSLVLGSIPNRLRLTITMSKILTKEYYEKPEDLINVINLYIKRFLNLASAKGKLAIFVNRNLLYHGEYSPLREEIVKSYFIKLLIDFGDYRFNRTKHGVALVVIDKNKKSEENTFKGINLLSMDQDQKEQLLKDFKDDYVPDEKVILRDIAQSEFLDIKGFRLYIKKPSKYFAKFSAIPNSLHEFIDSFENGIKVGENKVLYISDQKVKEYQLEQTMLKNALKGKNFHRFSVPENFNLLVIPPELTEEQIQTNVPNTWKYLLENKTFLESRPQVKKGLIKWYQVADAALITENSIKPPKIILREKANEPIAVFDTKGTLQISSALALRFNKQIRFRDYFKILAWINSLVVKAGYQDLTQDTKTDAIFSRESLHNVTIPLALLKDDSLASNIQQIVQMCLANKFSFNPHLLLLEYPEGQFHPDVYNFLFEKVYDVLIKKMKNLLDKTIKISDIATFEINQPNKKKKIESNFLYPIIQDYAKSILILKDDDLEISIKLKPRQAYTLPFLQLFLAYQPKEMISNYLKQYSKSETIETIITNWPIPELQMKHVMETYNFVRFQRQNYVNFFNRTKNMLIKVETLIATHYGFTTEEIAELLADRDLIQG